MQRAFDKFKESMQYVKELDSLYSYLQDILKLPNDLTDLLRAQWVYSVSAMDKLIHELVRTGMLDIFQGRRIATKKYSSFGITMDTHLSMSNSASITPPPQYWFEQEIIQRHKYLSFQEPDKISDALSLIWSEDHKWQKIASIMGISQADLTTRLKTIVSRRNQIVHEADSDIYGHNRNIIDKADVDSVVSFIEKLSEAIFKAVK